MFTGFAPGNFGEQAVDKNSLSDRGSLVGCSQFIERTEMDGGNRKKVVGRLKDDPRQLGKGRARLVGSAPLRPDRKVRRRRQDSPVPLVAVARGQLCEKELGGEGR